jgi:hypothetical protein
MNCACGCGTSFEPCHWRRRYFENHRLRVPGKTVPIRVPVEEAPKIKARLSRTKGRNNGVQRTDSIGRGNQALERETFRQVALWLKNRLDQKGAESQL